MHHCLNLAVDRDGRAGCVLIRAVELLDSAGGAVDTRSGSGPGRLTRCLEIDTSLSSRHLFERNARLTLHDGPRPRRVGVSTRIGIRHAEKRLLRFFDARSEAVSVPHRKPARRSE
jgi:DNA-3-methyladenine glycosylase